MMGLIVIAFFVVYLAISGLAILLSALWAKRHNRRPWLWGGLAAFVMYNLVFWDWIPTVAMHKYYCATEAGFWVYKTPEQWAKENPGVLETLSMSHLPEQDYKGTPPEQGKDAISNDRYYLLPDGAELRAYYDATDKGTSRNP